MVKNLLKEVPNKSKLSANGKTYKNINKYDYKLLKTELVKVFKDNNITEMADIDWIICKVTGKQRSMLPFCSTFTDSQIKEIMRLINVRIKHIPLDYIFGISNFMGREFKVSSDVLIPRLDTEILVECVKSYLLQDNKSASVLDIGSGSGIIAITLALETNSDVTAVDISSNALDIAKFNAKKLNANVKFLRSDLFEALKLEKFDVIVSNPPYIKSSVIDTLQCEVKDNEPILALDGGIDGLEFYKKIISKAPNYLNKGGRIFFEIGYDQKNDVQNLLKANFEDIETFSDFEGNDRVVSAKLKD